MTRRLPRILVAAFALCLVTFLTAGAARAEEKVDLQALIQDTQRMSSEPNEILIVWWIPTEFWEATMANDRTVTPQAAEQMIASLRPYVVMAVVEGKMGPMGGVTFRPEADVRKTFKLRDPAGREHTPMANQEVNADLRNLLAVMRPILANMIGPMGENMHFYVFKGTDAAGKPIVDPKGEGRLTTLIGERDLDFRLPLGALMPKRTCGKCEEALSGAYKFCPCDGAELTTSK